jgi:membrane-anchored glycerophosphoryl diester phosphodiesterase (GDPDase)
MDPLTLKTILIAWMLDVQSSKVIYFMPITVLPDQTICEKTLSDLKETHKRGYSYNLSIRGICVPAMAGE